MRKYKIAALKLMLLLVIIAEINSLVQANFNTEKYVQVFPGAKGYLFYLSQLTSFAALLNCILIWLRQKWAIWTNLIIGAWSILLVYILKGPAANLIIILSATLGVFILSLMVLDWFQTDSGKIQQ